jgi:hypothetical protein
MNLLPLLFLSATLYYDKSCGSFEIQKKRPPFFAALGHKPIYVANEIMSRAIGNNCNNIINSIGGGGWTH